MSESYEAQIRDLAGDFFQFSPADRVEQVTSNPEGVVEYGTRFFEPQAASSRVTLPMASSGVRE